MAFRSRVRLDMHFVPFFLLTASIARVYADVLLVDRTHNAQGLLEVKSLVNRLVQRLRKAWPRSHADLDKTTLTKTQPRQYHSTAFAKTVPPDPCFTFSASLFCPPISRSEFLRNCHRCCHRSVSRKASESLQEHSSSSSPFQAQEDLNYLRPSSSGLARGGISSEYSLIASATNLPDPLKVEKGGEDAWLVKASDSGGGVVAVADGVGGYGDMGIDSGLYARLLSYEVAQAYDPVSDLKTVADRAHQKVKVPGAATLCIVDVAGTELRAANIGDSGFRVIRDGEIVFSSPVLEHGFNFPYQLAWSEFLKETDRVEDAEVFSFPVQLGDLIVVGSDGLFDNVFDDDIARVATETAVGPSTLTATKAASEALAMLARKNSENEKYRSPFAVELSFELAKNKTGIDKFIRRTNLGGKKDDITVVVGKVASTLGNASDIKEAVAASDELARSMFVERQMAKVQEAKAMWSIVADRAQTGLFDTAERQFAKVQDAKTMLSISADRAKAAFDEFTSISGNATDFNEMFAPSYELNGSVLKQAETLLSIAGDRAQTALDGFVASAGNTTESNDAMATSFNLNMSVLKQAETFLSAAADRAQTAWNDYESTSNKSEKLENAEAMWSAAFRSRKESS